jgi:hypothetical protein
VTSYAFDPVSRLSQLAHDVGGTAQDVTSGFSYNPASQIVSKTRSNDSYAWNGHIAVTRLIACIMPPACCALRYTSNGINQYSAAGAAAFGYDGRGNLTSSGSSAYSYTTESRMATEPNAIFPGHEPSGDQILQLYRGSRYEGAKSAAKQIVDLIG